MDDGASAPRAGGVLDADGTGDSGVRPGDVLRGQARRGMEGHQDWAGEGVVLNTHAGLSCRRGVLNTCGGGARPVVLRAGIEYVLPEGIEYPPSWDIEYILPEGIEYVLRGVLNTRRGMVLNM